MLTVLPRPAGISRLAASCAVSMSAIVTGAAVGIGNAIARALHAEGARLSVCDVREEVNVLAGELGALATIADVAQPEDVRRVVIRAGAGPSSYAYSSASRNWMSNYSASTPHRQPQRITKRAAIRAPNY